MFRMTMGTGFAAAASIAVAAALVVGISMVESPEDLRILRYDQAREDNLNHLAAGIDCYYTLNRALPGDLTELVAEMDRLAQQKPLRSYCAPRRTTDPETDEPYRYRRLDDERFELCATFSLPSPEDPEWRVRSGHSFAARKWTHAAGSQCFEMTTVEVKVPFYN